MSETRQKRTRPSKSTPITVKGVILWIVGSIIGGVLFDIVKTPDLWGKALLFGGLAGSAVALLVASIRFTNYRRQLVKLTEYPHGVMEQDLKEFAAKLGSERTEQKISELQEATPWVVISWLAFSAALVGFIVSAPYLFS